jgi:CHAT domain-containing protein
VSAADQLPPPTARRVFAVSRMEFVVGRWVLGEKSVVTGKLEPPVPPPTEIEINNMFIVSGDYSETKNWKRLEQAELEAEELGTAYDATQVNATLDELLELLDSGVDGELLHFAVHGKYDPSGARDGIALVDGNMLDPLVVRSKKLKNRPLIFLNACQVGQGNTILGDYGGMAAAFLKAGAAAVIAPLWSVDDASAKAIAENFYSQLKKTSDPAELVRCKREDFKKNTKTGTYLAYQFFGHPKMRIGLNLPRGDGA